MRTPQPNIKEIAAVETASVIVTMMIARSFIKLSATSLITLVPFALKNCSLAADFCNAHADASDALRPTPCVLPKPRFVNDLKVWKLMAHDDVQAQPRPLSVQGRSCDTLDSRFEMRQER